MSQRPYPGGKSKEEVMKLQKDLQEDRESILYAALHGHFTIHPSHAFRLAGNSHSPNARGPLPLDSLRALDRYVAKWNDPRHEGRSGEMDFKFYQDSPLGHGECPASEVIWRFQAPGKLDLTQEKFTEGGLHYFIGETQLFWTMVITWKVHGTTFYKDPEGFEPGMLKSMDEWQQLAAKWDHLFALAKADPHNVPCMFYQTPIGCLWSGCPCTRPRSVRCVSFGLEK